MRYFFHLEDGACIRDPTGEEFADDPAAMAEAAKVSQELSKLRVHAYEWRVVVKRADSVRVGAVPLVAPSTDDPAVVITPESLH